MQRTKIFAAFTALAISAGTFLLHANAASFASDSAPAADIAPAKGEQVAVFAGGCFWGIEAVFEHVKGVRTAASGYAGGTADSANYEQVSSGRTRHAESVKVIYDPSQVSYGQLLGVFFKVAHDPTQLNRQGPDTGPQYRSAIFYTDAAQQAAAKAYIAQLERDPAYRRPVVTQVVPLTAFHTAEAYHQDYARRHPQAPYIVQHDAPKVRNLQASMPDLYMAR